LTGAVDSRPDDGPELDDLAFHVEQRGIDFIPERERWATPRALAGLWAGASVNVEYLVYGAILMTFGFSLAGAIVLIVLGNLSWVLLGLASLQGPVAGTTTFTINRAPFGPRGSKAIALCNWLTMIGFEAEGLILIVGAGLVLAAKGGVGPSTGLKVGLIAGAAVVQAVLPFLGHATMTRVLRWLVLPFVAIYVVLAGLSVGHVHATASAGTTWQTWTAGLAFTIALSGLGWTENGNDYSRYLPRTVSSRSVVGWLFVATALPEIALMTLGALVFSFVGTDATWQLANPFAAFAGAHALPGWFVVTFMVFVVIQLFGINSLDLYSSGVTLQAMGLRIRRYHAVLLDSAVCLGITFYAVFNSQFSTLLKDFVTIVIVWIAPWCGIFLADWLLRRNRYDPLGLQRTDATSPYWWRDGIGWPALFAQVIGGLAALLGSGATFLPDWLRALSFHTGGADVSVFLGLGVGAGAYALLAGGAVRRQVGLPATPLPG
jgi:nucleobase:cation symporter-1, NCS1 family